MEVSGERGGGGGGRGGGGEQEGNGEAFMYTDFNGTKIYTFFRQKYALKLKEHVWQINFIQSAKVNRN